MPLERVNSLLLIGYNESLVETAIKWIDELDRAPTEGRDSIYIYNVRNSVASELTDLVSSLIGEKSSQTKKKTTTSSTSTRKTVRPPGTTTKSKTTTTKPTTTRSTSLTSAKGASMQFAGEPESGRFVEGDVLSRPNSSPCPRGMGVVHCQSPGDAASCPGVNSRYGTPSTSQRCPSEHGEFAGLFNAAPARFRSAKRARHSPGFPHVQRAILQGRAPSTSTCAATSLPIIRR